MHKVIFSRGRPLACLAALLALVACSAPAKKTVHIVQAPPPPPGEQVAFADAVAAGYALRLNQRSGRDYGTYKLHNSRHVGSDVITQLIVTDPSARADMLANGPKLAADAADSIREGWCGGDLFARAFNEGFRIIDIFYDQRGNELMRVVVDRC